MADTVRTRAEILTLYADNVTGAITPQTHRDYIVSVFGVYGGLYVTGGASAQGLTTTPAKLTGFTTAMTALNTTPSTANDNIVLDYAGTYRVDFSVSGFGAAAATYIFQLYLNNAAVTGATMRYVATGTEYFSLHIVFPVTATAGQALDVRGFLASGSQNFTPVDMQLFADRKS